MAFITETMTGDKRIQLGNEDLTRLMGIGTNWRKIRIGMRVAMYDTGGNVSGLQPLVVGICQGTQYSYGSSSCTDFIGVSTENGGSYDWTRNASPLGYYTPFTAPVIKVGSTITTVGRTNFNLVMSGSPATMRSVMYVDITKGASYAFTLWSISGVGNLADFSRYAFLYQLENEMSNASSMDHSNLTSIAYSGAGLHDSVCVHWGRSIPTIEISDLSVVRFF